MFIGEPSRKHPPIHCKKYVCGGLNTCVLEKYIFVYCTNNGNCCFEVEHNNADFSVCVEGNTASLILLPKL